MRVRLHADVIANMTVKVVSEHHGEVVEEAAPQTDQDAGDAPADAATDGDAE